MSPLLPPEGEFVLIYLLPYALEDWPTVNVTPPVVELARVTDRGIRESGMLDMKQLVLEKDKSVIGIFLKQQIEVYF